MSYEQIWQDCIAEAADECGAKLTREQIEEIASAAQGQHENWDCVCYTPSWGDRFSDMEEEWKKKYKELEKRFEEYRGDAETAVKQALRQDRDSRVFIGKHGEVTKVCGREYRIQ